MHNITFRVAGRWYHLNTFALLLWVSGGGLNVFFTGKYAHLGTELITVAGVILQFMTTQDAPAKSVVNDAPGTAPDGTLNGTKVATVPRSTEDFERPLA